MPVEYYQLISIFDNKKVSYIPVENHQVQLRKLITVEEANEKTDLKALPIKEKQEIEYILKKQRKHYLL